jgi:hypothetical protein
MIAVSCSEREMRSALATVILIIVWSIQLHGQNFGGEIYHFASGSTNEPPGRCSLSIPVPAGARVVVLGAEDGNDYEIAAVTDSKGNSYRQVVSYKNTGFESSNLSIWSASLTTALTIHDTVTITWNTATALYRSYGISIVYLTGIAQGSQADATAKQNQYLGTPDVTVQGHVAKAPAIIVGMLLANDFVWKIRDGTIYDSQHVNINYEFFFKILSSACPYDPGGTASVVPATFASTWASFSSSP